MMCLNLVILFSVISVIYGHGYMESPPARNSLWRYGFPNPPNYNDNENFCGGRLTQKKNGGKCGICGDAAHMKKQPHMDGGRYSNGIIGRTYRKGETIEVQVYLTASHKGYFEFRIDEYDDTLIKGNDEGKLIGSLLKQPNGDTKFKVIKYGRQRLKIQLQLPQNLTCKRCVMQWWYRTGNSWGCDSEGCGMGHGAQEHFVNCADVRIE